ncbi:MAG: alkene reductase [Gammaproteobacteria bacterium]|nr:alkene reductase [Gammaproteobacteria bacterium]MCW5582594.1 alkene reductase [Gammaproteobacteria bacterium]
MNNHPLLTEYKLNKLLTLKNKILMAPMTRAKATNDLLPTDEMAEYYSRRANAGLIITEGTIIRHDALGYNNVPGIFSESQIKHWRKVTDKVHHHNGLIFLQIWHVGRVSHPVFLGGKLPLSPSETTMTGKIYRSDGLTYGKSRAATLNEIEEIINNYAIAAENAIKAGFDGIEIHGANGYLVDQFLHHHTNQREDTYGGSPENMARFALNVINACGQSIGFERVGIRLSPGAYLHEIIGDKRDALVFSYLLAQLNNTQIAYVHTGNFDDAQKFKELGDLTMSEFIRHHYRGNLIACGSYTFDSALDGVKNNLFDLVALGRPFIANPDLIDRLATNKNLNPYESSMLNTLY